jgi:hypothetical protein
MYNKFYVNLFNGVIGTAVVVTGIILCFVGINNSVRGFKFNKNEDMLISGIVLFLLGLYGIMVTQLTNVLEENPSKKPLFPVFILVTIAGFCLMVTAGSLGLSIEKEGEYIPISTTPNRPSDTECTNIMRTITYNFPWSRSENVVRIFFRLNIGYLPPSNPFNPEQPFLPTSLLVLTNDSKKIFEFRYESKKIFFDYYDKLGNLKTTLSIDIVPTFENTFYVSASIMGYDDTGGNMMGSLNLYNQTGDIQQSQLFRDLFISSNWGDNTVLKIKGENTVDSIQICTKSPKRDFFSIPFVYKVAFVVTVAILFTILILFLLPSNVKRAIKVGASPSIPDLYVKNLQ